MRSTSFDGASAGGPRGRQVGAVLQVATLLAVLVAPGPGAMAAAFLEAGKVVGAGVVVNDSFGLALDVDGDTMVVGQASATTTSREAVFVFVRSGEGWVQQAKVVAGDPAPGDRFGSAVAVDGDTLVVGAPRDDDGGTTSSHNSGSVYVFARSNGTWTQQAKLGAWDPRAGNAFGTQVALDAGTLAVHASGAVYVLTGGGGAWTRQAKLAVPVAFNFPPSLALDGDILAAGNHEDSAGAALGRVDVFVRANGTWSREAVLSGPSYNSRFGWAVGLSGDRLAVGAPQAGGEAGQVMAFTRLNRSWSLDGVLADPSGRPGDNLGWSVDLHGERLVVGAADAFRAGLGFNVGAGLVLERIDAGWTITARLQAADGAPGDRLGYRVGLLPDGAVLTAPRDDDRGSVYPFLLDTDGDALSDTAEVQVYGTDPLDPDTDDDVLLDGAEVKAHRTNPLDPDTDDDVLRDGAEVLTHLTDPLDSDTDDDALGDGAEVLLHATAPRDPDTDHDGLPDGLLDGAEVSTYRTDPLAEDTDRDLYGDGTEVGCGTDPTSALSLPLPACGLPDPGLVPIPAPPG